MSTSRIPIYDIVIDDDSLGLTALSFVDYPAISEDFIAMSKEREKVWLSKEKHEVVGAMLIPNQLILRYAEDGSAYYIRWSKDTIRKAAEKYLMSGKWNNFTYMHEAMDAPEKTRLKDGIYMQRLWIIENSKTDDANTKYGFHLPEGTLMAKCKVYNRSIWNEIKSGNLKGFSIEAYATLKNNNKMLEISYSKMKDNKFDFNEKQFTLFQKFVSFLNSVSSDAENIADEAKKDETNSGIPSIQYFIDNEHYIIVDAEGYARDEENNLVDTGEYRLADGNVLEVGEDNKFVGTHSVADATEDDNKEEAPIAEATEEEKNKDDEKIDEEPKGEDKPKVDDVSDENDDKADDKIDEDSTVEKPKGEDDKPIDEPVEDEPQLPTDLVPYEINGEEFLIPQPVVDYINSLLGVEDELQKEVAQLKATTPSAKPIGNVIKQSAEKVTETYTLSDAIRRLNWKR